MNVYSEDFLTFSKVMGSSEVPRGFHTWILSLCTIRNNKPCIKHLYVNHTSQLLLMISLKIL